MVDHFELEKMNSDTRWMQAASIEQCKFSLNAEAKAIKGNTSRLRPPKPLHGWKRQFDILLSGLDSMVSKQDFIEIQMQLERNRVEIDRLQQAFMLNYGSVPSIEHSENSLSIHDSSEVSNQPQHLSTRAPNCSLANGTDPAELAASAHADSSDHLEHYNPRSPEAHQRHIGASGPQDAVDCNTDGSRAIWRSPVGQLEVRGLRWRLQGLVFAKEAELAAAARAGDAAGGASVPALRAELGELARMGRLLDAAARTDLRGIAAEVDGLERLLCRLRDSPPPSATSDPASAPRTAPGSLRAVGAGRPPDGAKRSSRLEPGRRASGANLRFERADRALPVVGQFRRTQPRPPP